MSILTTKDELKSYILRQLGDGVHNIEVTPSQLDDCIENAIGYYEREVDGGVENKVYIMEIYPDTEYYILDDEVMGVEEIVGTEFSGSNDLTSTLNQVKLDVAKVLTEGTSSVKSYVTTMQYWSFINQFVSDTISYSFNTVTKKLTIHTGIEENGVIVLDVLWSTRNTKEMWNNDFIKEYSTALAMRQWGINMSKFNGAQLIGGMELNGSGMIDMAQSEIDRLREDLIDKQTSPLGIWVG